MLDNFDQRLDDYYVANISGLLLSIHNAEEMIKFWESKRRQLRITKD